MSSKTPHRPTSLDPSNVSATRSPKTRYRAATARLAGTSATAERSLTHTPIWSHTYNTHTHAWHTRTHAWHTRTHTRRERERERLISGSFRKGVPRAPLGPVGWLVRD